MAVGQVSDIGRWVTGCSWPKFEATTPHLSVLHPLHVENGVVDPRSGEKAFGIPIGKCGPKNMGKNIGGYFAYDEFELYRLGILQSLNVCVLGQVSMRESTLVKLFIHRAFLAGYNSLVIDPKDEYDALAHFIGENYDGGSKILRFGENTDYFLNPMDPMIDEENQLDLIATLLVTAIADQSELDVIQRSLLHEAIKRAKTESRVPLLPDVWKYLADPTPAMATSLGESVDYLKKRARTMRFGMRELTEGSLAGMFHQPTSKNLFDGTPLLVMSCKSLGARRAAVAISVFNNLVFGHTKNANPKNRFHRIFIDEAWDLTEHKAFVTSLRRLTKLGGTTGQAVWFVVHHLENLFRSGEHKAVKDLLPDTGTVIGFHMDQDEVIETAQKIRYNASDIAQNADLQPGESLWKIAHRPALKVTQERWPEEIEITETRHLAKGKVKTIPSTRK